MCDTFGLDSVGWVEMVALRKPLEREVGEDRSEPSGHSAVVVGVAEAAEREVDRTIEGSQGSEVEIAAVERVDECS